jgi:2'-hydroxyisoflavone reductase
VIDTCGYFPRIVRESAGDLANQVGQYIFISSISVYADFSQPGINESSPVGQITNPDIEEITNESYGPLKALCEQAVESELPGRALIIRPGLIVGPFDPTDRFTYWLVRVAQGGNVLAPDSPDWCTQFIDARDLAAWIIHLIETRQTGIFNATGPAEALTFGKLLQVCNEIADVQSIVTWVPTEYLLTRGIEPWSEIPLWLPGEENAGADQVDIQKALAAGLSFRSLDETVGETLAWAASRPTSYQLRAGIDREKEANLLRDWHDLIN